MGSDELSNPPPLGGGEVISRLEWYNVKTVY